MSLAAPPAVYTPPGVPSPSAPGAVHAVAAASPSVPGAVHVVPGPQTPAPYMMIDGIILSGVAQPAVYCKLGYTQQIGEGVPNGPYYQYEALSTNIFIWRDAEYWTIEAGSSGIYIKEEDVSSPHEVVGWLPQNAGSGAPVLTPLQTLPPVTIHTGPPAATPGTPPAIT